MVVVNGDRAKARRATKRLLLQKLQRKKCPLQSVLLRLENRHPKEKQRRLPSHKKQNARDAHVLQKPLLSRQKFKPLQRVAVRPSNDKPSLRQKKRWSSLSKPRSRRRQPKAEKRARRRKRLSPKRPGSRRPTFHLRNQSEDVMPNARRL